MKVHRQVSLVKTNDPLLTEELLARKTLARRVVGRLSDCVLLISPESEASVLEELRRMGHSPRLVRADEDPTR